MKRYLLAAALCLMAASCQRADPGQGKLRIALVLKTLNSPFFIDMEAGARKAAARHENVELVVQAAEREVDVEKQIQIVENLIATRISALLITPSGSREVAGVIKKAQAAGVRVVVLDTRIDPEALKGIGAEPVPFIGSDNYEGGRRAGEYLAKLLDFKGDIALLEGIPGHETGDMRKKGFLDVIGQYSGLRLVASQTANWEMKQGFDVFQNMLTGNPSIRGLFAANDMMALGALEALDAAGRTGQVMVVGFDATREAKEAIRKGLLAGSVAQYPAEMGRLGVEWALRLRAGETMPEYIETEVELITEKNLQPKTGG